MSWSIWLYLTLGYIPMAGSMGNTVNCQLDIHQPNRVIWQNRGQSASLPCHLNVNCSGFQFLWFVFKEDSHHQIDLETKPHKYSQDGARLTINSLNGNDSGIYHCAAVFPKLQPVPRAPEIGPGTKLAVRGEGMRMVWHILLWSLFVLLAIYSLALIILIIRKKTGKDISICGGAWKTAHQNNSTKSMQFHAVVQELYSKRNLRNNTPKKDNLGPSQNKAESPQSNHSADDIYQNL